MDLQSQVDEEELSNCKDTIFNNVLFFCKSWINFNAKYVSEDTELIEFIISDKKKIELEQICLKTLNIVKASGWLRVDLMQDSNQNFYVLEVNTVPGMTSHSLFPKSAESIGLSYDELVNEIINAEI